MEEADAVRRAARASVDDIEPPALRDELRSFIDGGSMVPGVLAVLTARACAADPAEGVVERAAGVQLIYDGLRLTRRLAREEPWRTGDPAGDMHVLAADVLVARGFYLLARTEAASAAVEVVRAFGRDQTDGGTADALEVDVLDLAVVAGATAGDVDPTPELRSVAADFARGVGPEFPPADSLASADAYDTLVRSVDGAVADH
ncbi:hypothetical protein ACFQPA_14385 [Halomarina halobia]|uniref:Polyprenyl synthetase n=1 Tax=Halomarina halobia TaxID=3033386 RepID=A0ABD6A8K9_9EURY|nr:hypothetical protein [Halomarina sp. PSR21]